MVHQLDAISIAQGLFWTDQEVFKLIHENLTENRCKLTGYSGNNVAYLRPPQDVSPFDCPMRIFPLRCLHLMRDITSKQLHDVRVQQVSSGEILKFLGTSTLMKRFAFPSRCNQWNETRSIYIRGSSFGKILSYNFREKHHMQLSLKRIPR